RGDVPCDDAFAGPLSPAGKKRVIALNFHFMGIVRNKLQAGTLSIEHLAAASDKPGAVGFERAHGVRETNIRRFWISLGKLPGHAAGLHIEGKPNAPDDTGTIRIGEGFVLTYELNGHATRGGHRLDVVVKIEILVGSSLIAALPTLG